MGPPLPYSVINSLLPFYNVSRSLFCDIMCCTVGSYKRRKQPQYGATADSAIHIFSVNIILICVHCRLHCTLLGYGMLK